MEHFKEINPKHCKVYQIKKEKRYRSAFTTDQINCLESEFKKSPYIGVVSRKELANIVHIPERAIKIWFQNRRMKEKKYTSEREVNINDKNKPNDLFAKDQLTNVHTSKSVNDQHYHLQTLRTGNGGSMEVNSKTYDNFNDFKEKRGPYFTVTEHKHSFNKLENSDDVHNKKSSININNNINYSSQSKTNNIDSRRYYTDTKTIAPNVSNNLMFRDCRIKTFLPTQTSVKRKYEAESKKMLQNHSLNIKKKNVKQHHRLSNLESLYVPVNMRNRQPVSYSLLSNALRKPLPHMVERGSSRSISHVQPDISLPIINQAGKNCNCTCHVHEFQDSGRTPYILAIPLSHFDNNSERNSSS